MKIPSRRSVYLCGRGCRRPDRRRLAGTWSNMGAQHECELINLQNQETDPISRHTFYSPSFIICAINKCFLCVGTSQGSGLVFIHLLPLKTKRENIRDHLFKEIRGDMKSKSRRKLRPGNLSKVNCLHGFLQMRLDVFPQLVCFRLFY